MMYKWIDAVLECSTMTPDNVGPIAGANMITSPTNPITFPRDVVGILIKFIKYNRHE